MTDDSWRRRRRDAEFDKARVVPINALSFLQDPGIVRHRGKIEATINNAKCAKELVKLEGSLAVFFWKYEPDPKAQAAPQSVSVTEGAKRLSKDLKKMGWKFIGPTTVFAFMQAMGLVNDHDTECVTGAAVAEARERFKRP